MSFAATQISASVQTAPALSYQALKPQAVSEAQVDVLVMESSANQGHRSPTNKKHQSSSASLGSCWLLKLLLTFGLVRKLNSVMMMKMTVMTTKSTTAVTALDGVAGDGKGKDSVGGV